MDKDGGQSDPLGQKLGVQQLDLALKQLTGLPTPPSAAAKLLDLLGEAMVQPDAEAALVEQALAIIGADPALTAMLLAKAGESGSPAASVKEAAGALGIDGIASVVLGCEAFKQRSLTPGGLDHVAFRRHCLAVACASEIIARRTGLADPQEAFACGLLHDIGKLAMERCFPKSYVRALRLALDGGDLAAAERQVIGLDHAVVGRRLAEQWRLPPNVAQVIWLHHQPAQAVPRSAAGELVAVVAVADAIARRQRLWFSGNAAAAETPPQVLERLGLDKHALDEIASELGGAVRQRDDHIGPIDERAETLYHDALARANARIVLAGSAMHRRQVTLENRSTALDCLGVFAAGLSGESTVTDVLARIGEAVVAACPSAAGPVAVYSLDSQGQEALAVRLDGQSVAWRLLPLADSSNRSPGQKSPPSVQPADEAIGGLFGGIDDWAEWFDLRRCVHWPIACQGRLIGGLVAPLAARRQQGQDVTETLLAVTAPALAIAQDRARAVAIGEQLAEASQVLASAQQALAEAKTLSAIGELAAGAAHELNNPLAVVSGRAQLMRQRAVSPEDRKVWDLIIEQTHRMSDIITALMEYASPPPPSPSPIDLRRMFESAAKIFSSSDHPQAQAAQVDIEIADDAPAPLADETQMLHVIVELITNAATAAVGKPHVRLWARADERGVLLGVRDDGPGMDQETAKSAFTPFFSAQRAGRRRGLGLSRAKRLVENNDGRIWIVTGANEGANVFVQLPAAPGVNL